MTAIRNFPDAPLGRRKSLSGRVEMPAWATSLWRALHRIGELRAARELASLADRHALRDPVLARQLRAAAAEFGRGQPARGRSS
jgi:hypothetical protein